MTRILVVYGTTEGQTAKIARELGVAIQRVGVEADVFQALPSSPGPCDYDGVIVAASLHAGRYQKAVRRWLRQHSDALRGKPSAFVSVCLAVKDPRPEAQAEVRKIMVTFADSCAWMPAYLKPVAGALAYTRYNWLTRWFMLRMARRNGGDTDTTRDHDYTDWADVRAFGREFAVGLMGARQDRPLAVMAG